MSKYVRNICADGEECQPLPGTYKAPECYILRSVNELEDPMPIKHKWGYLAIACIACGFGIIETALGGYLYNIHEYATSSNLNIATFLVKNIYLRGIGGWWASMVVVIAGGIAIAAVVQPKSQKAFVLASCIASGIAIVLSLVAVCLEGLVYAYQQPITACVTTYLGAVDATTTPDLIKYYGKSQDFDEAKACMVNTLASNSPPYTNFLNPLTGNCFCVSANGAQCSMINNAYTSSNCSLSMSFDSRQLASICFGALDIGITVCLFVYSIVILVEQPPVSIADDKGVSKSVISTTEPSIYPINSVPAMKI
jgi:hypothetical protein